MRIMQASLAMRPYAMARETLPEPVGFTTKQNIHCKEILGGLVHMKYSTTDTTEAMLRLMT